ncbi:MAG: glycoside hydrolase family 15 protein [Acidobacteriota bacterium]
MKLEEEAPGQPGEEGHWGIARKQDIATAIDETSRVWFTLARGRLDEVFFPRPDHPCVRSLGLAIADGELYVEDDDAAHAASRPDEAAPILSIASRHAAYSMHKETIVDPRSDTVLQRIRWDAGARAHLFAFLEPHVGMSATGVAGCVLDHCGRTVLGAEGDGVAVALAASTPWCAASVGFAGVSDGRTDLRAHGRLTRAFRHTGRGHVILTGELDRNDVVLALGFADTMHQAAQLALAALSRGYDDLRGSFIDEWRRWHGRRDTRASGALWTRSACVLKTLETKLVGGGRVAALAKPWGPSRAPRIDGAYHLVWTRDLVETMGGLIAAGAHAEARQALTFLAVTQEADGHWAQNTRVDGQPVWQQEEVDETALPILLVDLMLREHVIDDRDLDRAWPVLARAADHLIDRGLSTELDRWEDTGGATPFTVASEVAALATCSRLARRLGDRDRGHRLHGIAVHWDQRIDELLYRRGGPLAERLGIAGYYVRARKPGARFPELRLPVLPPTELSPDALALVRFGLRAPDDPRIRDTVTAIDAVLQVDIAGLPGWRRYPGDHYGEYPDGRPFDGGGVGRSWPLLVGERAHYELALGRIDRARALARALEHFASATGMISEQVWDAPDVLERGLVRGQPTWSASPLGWAHAEYLKLCRSLADGRVFDLPSVF